MSLEQFDIGSTYGNSVVKRKKRGAVGPYGRKSMQIKSDYALVQQSPTSCQFNVHTTGIAQQIINRSTRGVILLNGERYELVGNIVAGGKTEIVLRRAAVNEAIDDGTINYNRLAAQVIRKQDSAKVSKAARLIADPEADSGFSLPLSKVVPAACDSLPRTIIISITGSLVERTAMHLVIDWYGGSKLTIARLHAEGDWDLLQVGQWFEATVSRRMNGEVVRAMLIGPIDEPEGFSEVELTDSYSSIPAAQLDSVK